MIGVNQGLWIGTCRVQGSLLERLKLHLESPMEVTTGNKPGRNIQRSGILINHLDQLAKLLDFPQMLGCFVFGQLFTKNTEKEGF